MPPLRSPVLIAAFEGWNDAADAASRCVDHLETVWEARAVAAIDPEDYYDFQVNRPTVGVDDEGMRRITWPTTRLSVCSPARRAARRHPAARHRAEHALARVLRRAARRLRRARGRDGRHPRRAAGRHAAHPPGPGHRAPRASPRSPTGSSSSCRATRAHRHRRRAPGRLRAGRHPRGVVLGGGAALRGTAAVPQGDARAAAPARGPARQVRMPLGDLPEEARAWERGVDELAAEDEEIADYVRALEEPATPPTCRRPAARRSPGSSSATSAPRLRPGRRPAEPAGRDRPAHP